MKQITALLLTFLLLCSLTFASATFVEAYAFGLTTEMTLLEEIGRPIARKEQVSIPGITLIIYDLERRTITLSYNDEMIMWVMDKTEVVTWALTFAEAVDELKLNKAVFVISGDQLQEIADSL